MSSGRSALYYLLYSLPFNTGVWNVWNFYYAPSVQHHGVLIKEQRHL